MRTLRLIFFTLLFIGSPYIASSAEGDYDDMREDAYAAEEKHFNETGESLDTVNDTLDIINDYEHGGEATPQ